MALLSPAAHVLDRPRAGPRAGVRDVLPGGTRRTLCLVPLVALVLTAVAMGEEVSEHQVKAAFLFNFVKFVTWPPEAFHSPTDPIALCVLGPDPFGADLDRVVRDKTVDNRTFTVLRIGTSAAARHCHVVFIPAEQEHPQELLRQLRGLPILTVGEAHDFLAWAGVINFVMENGQVRFEISLEAADGARLKISSRLLALARVVQVGSGPKGGE